MINLSVTLSNVRLQNPVIAASGCFGYGEEFRDFYDINLLGAFSCKGTTLHPRFGNPTPRIAETNGGMINSVGLQNPGIEAVTATELPRLFAHYQQPLLANISGFSREEYTACCEQISAIDGVSIVELNISCPNVHGGGMSFGADAACAAAVTAACKAVCKKPLYVKLSPNVTNIAEIAKAVEAAGADGLSLINTLLAMRINTKTRKPILANTFGGLSGPAIFPVALRMVYQVYDAVKIPIIGLGGVSSAGDVIEMMMAGASAVQVGAATLTDPFACKKIIDALPETLQTLGIEDINEIIGAAH
ncbi:MAG: dihydroorotate dehydrogenase [Oscillospiraceae bacterium]|jgi:dihydroorotate dehydrogenase (NAD+) catalytic subunit|nr:dihydroorotate dehydrogenase [Oscillospiraceae bacterium]